MSFVDSLGSLGSSLSGALGKGLSFAEGILGSAASIKSSLEELQAKASAHGYTIPGIGGPYSQPGSVGAGTGQMGQNLATTAPGPGENTASPVPVLLLFVGALGLVVFLARR